MTNNYFIPIDQAEITLVIKKSQFIANATYTPTVEAAKAFIATIKAKYKDASHHVYAFAVGYGASVVHGMSNAGEPAGTAGKPTLAVVKGCGLGDITVVTTRYWGGTKLGTGGLVKAYTEAAQLVLAEIARVEKVEKETVVFTVPYNLYEQVTRLIGQHQGQVDNENFGVSIELKVIFPVSFLAGFKADLIELSAGKIKII